MIELEQKKADWWAFHQENPSVWNFFESFAIDALRNGMANYSYNAVMARVKWEYEIACDLGRVIIKPEYAAFYARLFHVKHPNHNGFFRIEPSKLERLINKNSSKADVIPFRKCG